jgi:aryl-alcohol dehydrogenase-like predicted oxidoreductase
MNYRALGSTGLSVSEIGFGTWGLGGDSGGSVAYGPVDDNASRDALRLALDQGVNFYDTSDLYGFGHSEKILGKAFLDSREKVVIASKGGFVDAVKQDFSVPYLRQAVERSLDRLRTDYIDLYQLHSPAVTSLIEQPETVVLMKELQAAGKIRAWGLSARSPEEARIAIENFSPPVVQFNFNLVDQRAQEIGLFALCKARKTGVIIRTPLCFGFLSTDGAKHTEFHSTDHRGRWSPQQRQRWSEAGADFAAVAESMDGQTHAQLALRYCLSFDSVSTVIPGMLTVQHVQENTRASALGPLTPPEMQRIQALYGSRTYFVPKFRPPQQ